jgi:hypothetical protein
MFTMRASGITGQRMLAACCLAVVALLAVACGSAGTSATPTKTVTVTATPPGSPAPAPPASSGPLPCLTTDLRLTVGPANGTPGTIFYPLDFTNASSSACTMYGYPGVAFVSSPGGSQVGAPAGRDSVAPTLITVSPGATAHAMLAVSDVLIANNCRHHQVQVSWVQVYPPDQYSALSARLSRQGCADRSLVTMHVSTVSSGS